MIWEVCKKLGKGKTEAFVNDAENFRSGWCDEYKGLSKIENKSYNRKQIELAEEINDLYEND